MSFNCTGIWKANLRKSKFIGPPPDAISINIEQSERELREEVVVTKLDVSRERLLFECHINGQQDGNLNGTPVRGGARWDGEELVIETWIQFGAREMHFCDYWSLSSDGQTLIMQHRNDDLAGQLTILDRVK